MNPRAISVRHMGADDEEVVKALAGRVFSPLASLSFPRPPDALIAERGGELLGPVRKVARLLCKVCLRY